MEKKRIICIQTLALFIILSQQSILCMIKDYTYIVKKIAMYSFYISIGLILILLAQILKEFYKLMRKKEILFEVIILSVGGILSSYIYVDFISNVENPTINYPYSVVPYIISLLSVLIICIRKKKDCTKNEKKNAT